MTIQDLGSIGELIAAVSTVATLAYLAAQIRQNTNELRAAGTRDSSANNVKWLDVLHRPGARQAYSVGLRNYPDMPAEQMDEFAYAFDSHQQSVVTAFALCQSGALEEEKFDGYLAGFACHVVTPRGRAYWDDCKTHYYPPFVDVVERGCREDNLPDILKNPHFQLDETAAPSESSPPS